MQEEAVNRPSGPGAGDVPYLLKMQTEVTSQRESGRNSRRSDWGELALLNRIRARVKAAQDAREATELRLGIGDDCALLRPRVGEELALTTDLSIADRHFRLDWHPPEAVGHRVLARGLSDLAAMGARPLAAFLSLGMPRELIQRARGRKPWVDRFFDGLLALAGACKVPLAGGDLAESPVAAADIVLLGAVKRGKALLRSGARPGDLLYVTGTLGGAAAGLSRLQFLARAKPARPFAAEAAPRTLERLHPLLAAHLYPQPRVPQGLALARRGLASAAIDLSDGLSTDLAHLCEESGVAAELDFAALPIAAGATVDQALHGGEDYELLFAAAPDARMPRMLAGVTVTRIGLVLRRRKETPAILLVRGQGKQPLKARGWEHFS